MKNKILCLLLLMSLGLTACNVSESGQGTIKTKKDAISKSYDEDGWIDDWDTIRDETYCPESMTKIFEASSDHKEGKMDPTLDVDPNDLFSIINNGCQIRAVVEIASGGVGSTSTYNCAHMSMDRSMGGFTCLSASNSPWNNNLVDGFNLGFTYDENDKYNAVYFSELSNNTVGYVDLALYAI